MSDFLYRPHEFDDWGMIRNADGSMYASVRRARLRLEAAIGNWNGRALSPYSSTQKEG